MLEIQSSARRRLRKRMAQNLSWYANINILASYVSAEIGIVSEEEGGEKEWGSWLRAPPRRVAGQNQSRWLRDENDDTWEPGIGGASNN